MKFRFNLLLFVIAFALLSSACSGKSRVIATSWPGVATDGETVYLSYASHIYGINGANGSELWAFPKEENAKISFYAPPALGADGQLIVGGYNNILYSLNPQTGEPTNWEFTEARNRYIGGPLITEQLILAPSSDNNLYAVDFDGTLSWKFTTEEAQWAQPASDGQTVFLTSLDHNLYAINLNTGEKIWQVHMGGAVVGQPAVAEGIVYVGSFAKNMTALDAKTGDQVWEFPTSNWVWAGPAIEDGTLYFGDIDGNFYALDASSGEKKWDYKAEGGIYSTPLVVDGKIYFTTVSGTIYALSTENELLWAPQKIGGKIYSSPVAVGNLILISTLENEKVVIALDENGIERWFYPPPATEQ